MLKSLDILIGLIVVLLALSMAVTVITQAITTIVNSRGRHLRRGLTDLLQLLDPAFDAKRAKEVATRILTYPLVSGSNTPFPGGGRLGRRLGNVVHREEFIKLLIGFALDPRAAGAPQAPGPMRGQGQPTDDVRDAVNAALQAHGIDPKATLEAIRSVSLQLERSAPELSNMARQNAAILLAAPNDFVAKINSWFDQTMDRTSQRFTASTRVITFVGAFLVAFGLQVDTPSLVNRLAADDALRVAFVEQATANGAGVSAMAKADLDKGRSDPDAQKEREYRAFLAANGIIKLPTWDHLGDGFTFAGIFGMLVTALLLSLGAPFWYNALSQLLQLRSVLAGKDDLQRAERQLATETATSAAGRTVPTVPHALKSERGDLAALG
jgi:hypothetical protein